MELIKGEGKDEDRFHLIDVHLSFTLPIEFTIDSVNEELYNQAMTLLLITVETLRVGLKERVNPALELEVEL
jgi:hypothetical protein